MTASPERMIAETNLFERNVTMDLPYYENFGKFVAESIQNDPKYLSLIMFDLVMNDWHVIIRRRIDLPDAIFTGEHRANVPCQRWRASAIPNAGLYV